MAIKKPLDHAFKKGQSGNPAGRRPGTTLIPKEIKVMGSKAIAESVAKYIGMGMDELYAVIKDPKAKVLDMMIAKICYESIRKGDQARLNALLDRMVGKVPDKIDHTTNGKSVMIQFVAPGESNDSGQEG
jgi:hypothetical protein